MTIFGPLLPELARWKAVTLLPAALIAALRVR